MKKILYLHQYFVTPEEYGATRSYWFAKKLIENGYQVTVISSISSTTKRLPGRYNIDGIDVIYLDGEYSNLHSNLFKLYNFLKFFIKALFEALKIKNIDLVYATSTPITVGAIALLHKKIKKVNYIFEVRDLWPDFPIQMGVIKNKYLKFILKKLEQKIYENSEHIVALSPGMKDGVISSGIRSELITVIPNMSKPDIFYPRGINKEILSKFSINSNQLNVIHFGSMGKANGLNYIINAAKILTEYNNKEIAFYFAGYGTTEELLKTEVEKNNLKNVFFLGKHNTFMISELVNCMDVSLVCFLNNEILKTNSPNKLFDSLSAGKLIIVNSSGWTKDLVENYNCGYFVNPENAEDLANKLIHIFNNKNEQKIMSNNSRKISIEIFDKEILTIRFKEVIDNYFNL
jgi:glycosyltransferase involved in cell wall biosynthesis